MPRVSPLRPTGNEANLALRIAAERDAKGWSYETLARKMTDAGYPIQPTGIFKIEKGKPPRRITVDELVGFARVFGTDVEELLQPPELVNQRRAQELVAQLEGAATELENATRHVVDSYVAYMKHIRDSDRSLIESVDEQFMASAYGPADMEKRLSRDYDPDGFGPQLGKHVKLVVAIAQAIGGVTVWPEENQRLRKREARRLKTAEKDARNV